jgi:hypothetical protein
VLLQVGITASISVPALALPLSRMLAHAGQAQPRSEARRSAVGAEATPAAIASRRD